MENAAKKSWGVPQAVVQAFEANEYVAACGDTEYDKYKFVCNAGNKYSKYNVYLADGTPYATNRKDTGGCTKEYTSYSPCGDTHEAYVKDIFLDGYMYKQNWNGSDSGEKIDIIIWTENYTNVHCTTNLDRNSWEMAKS